MKKSKIIQMENNMIKLTYETRYYSLLPTEVRYSDISPSAKLLYAELDAMVDENNYCYENNEYFSFILDVSKRTIQRWINELSKKGFITIEFDNKERKIRINLRLNFKK